MASRAEEIPRAANLRETREPAERARLLLVEEPADERGLVFLHADALRERAIRENGDAIDALSRERADLELQLQGHFMVRVHCRRGLDFQPQVHIFRTRIGLLSDAEWVCSGGIGKGRGVEDDGNLVRLLLRKDQVRQAGAVDGGSDNRAGTAPRDRRERNTGTEEARADSEEQADAVR